MEARASINGIDMYQEIEWICRAVVYIIRLTTIYLVVIVITITLTAHVLFVASIVHQGFVFFCPPTSLFQLVRDSVMRTNYGSVELKV